MRSDEWEPTRRALKVTIFDCIVLSMPVNTNFPPLTVETYKILPETGPRYQLHPGLVPSCAFGAALFQKLPQVV